ncbi:MAG: helix-turn-helix domain-containing protein, partial [Gallionella sp.]|nr:helix-turn-helix domain-containing protein [Gallionella sp.]
MMEQLPENKSVDGVDALPGDSAAQLLSVGQLLREGRERAGLSVEEVVVKIKLAPRQIVALEADDFQSLPETAFVRGFVRSYAKLLEMDAQPLLDALPGAKTAQAKVDPLHVDAPFPTARTMRRQSVNLLIAAFLVVLAIVGFALWQGNTPEPVAQEQSAQTVADEALVEMSLPLSEQVEMLESSVVPESAVPDAAAQSPEVAAVTTPAAVTQSAAALRLVFDRESWAEIQDRSGRMLSRQVNLAGSELR